MKKFCFLFLFVVGFTFANNSKVLDLKQSDPKIGDVLVINSPSSSTYKHIDFPKLNIISKRGGIGHYKSVLGNHVVVKEVITNENGTTSIVVERQDKTKFFGFLKQVEANYTKSIATGEISKI